ncbi:MAG: DUF5979 domain-containing protein, partial [Oscillospiraceae bacterium]|nr:DUF5979 domain-containing protein [Oscillospiraceae bacterium]
GSAWGAWSTSGSGGWESYSSSATVNDTPLHFINTYTADAVTPQFHIRKTASGAVPASWSATFSLFSATYTNDSTWTKSPTATTTQAVSNSTPNATFSVGPYSSTAGSPHYFIVEETAASPAASVNRQYLLRVTISGTNPLQSAIAYKYREWNGSAWGAWSTSGSGGWESYSSSATVNDTPLHFINTYIPPTGDLTISKEVFGDPAEIDDNTTFFDIRVKIGGLYMTANADNEYTGADESGSVFQVSVNASVTITNIPIDTVCVVEEVPGSGDVYGWRKEVSYSPSATVTIVSGTAMAVTVNNLYAQPHATGDFFLIVHKYLEGWSDPTDGLDFKFNLTEMVKNPDNTYSVKQPGGHSGTITILGENMAPVDGIPRGMYSFELPEYGLPPSGETDYYYYSVNEDSENPFPGWLYDENEYIVTVSVVYDAQENAIVISVTYPDGKEQLSFSNTYAGPRFPEVGGIGKNAVIAAGTAIVLTASTLLGGTWIYGKKHKRRKLLVR